VMDPMQETIQVWNQWFINVRNLRLYIFVGVSTQKLHHFVMVLILLY